MKEKIQVGIIGFGLSGRVFQAPFLQVHEGFIIKKIKSSRQEEIQATYPDVEVVTTEKDILEDDAIDLVIISTPNATHYPLAKQALIKGKHVVVEKPFVTSIAEGEELIALANEKELVLSVFQNRRWDNDFLTLQKIIKEGHLGRIIEFESHFDRFRPQLNHKTWKTHANPGSGVFYDLGPHLIDQALVLFGMPQAVFADIRMAREVGEVDDTFEVILYYDKLRVKLKAGVFVKELGPRLIVHGDKGSFVKYGLDPQEGALKEGCKPHNEDWGTEVEGLHGILHVVKGKVDIREKYPSEKGNYLGYFHNIYQAIHGEADLIVKPEQALNVIRIIHQAFESQQQQAIIPIP